MPSSDESPLSQLRTPDTSHAESDDGIDLRTIFKKLSRGCHQIIALALLGAAAAAVIYLIPSGFLPVGTTTRVTFSFPGIGNGNYPDGSAFSPDDLTAPDVVGEAIKSQSLDPSSNFQNRISTALSVEGVIPPDVVKDRDRLRAAGQTLKPYVPSEYAVSLTLPRGFPLGNSQRNLLLNAIVGAYRSKFERTYGNIPLAFGNAFETLHNADYIEYEQILSDEVQNIIAYLNEQLAQAKNFRSATTNFSFSDLLHQTDIFSELRLNETLGIIRQNALSTDRQLALVKMDYYLQTLEDREQKAIEDEKVIRGLLSQAEDRAQSYVLGIKSQAAQPRPEAPVLDQGLIDSLLANDSYNFLVRKALDAGLAVKQIQSEKYRLLERRKSVEIFLRGNHEDQSSLIAQVKKSLGELQIAYHELIANIRNTQADFSRQQFADAIRLSDGIKTNGMLKPLTIASIVGLLIGAAIGMGLSLLGVYWADPHKS